MKLTVEQEKAISGDLHAVVDACPGSGKTRTLIAKLILCVERVKDTPRKVACITYTNAAVHEIEYRVRNSGTVDSEGAYEISTIHVFCLNNILRPFHWRLEKYTNGFDVLSIDSDAYVNKIEELGQSYKLDRWSKEKFENISRQLNGDAIIPEGIPLKAIQEYWAWQENEGYIDFSNIIYYSYFLLKRFPSIARTISCRFANILVDEFQDTSELQKSIFSLIHEQSESIFFLVGDPEQSIYGFAGAKPHLMSDFCSELNAKSYSLAGNFRSTKSVIDCAEKIIPRTPSMFAANSDIEDLQPPKHITVNSDFEAIKDHFIPALDKFSIPYGNAVVLATSWMLLLPLGKKLRELGIPIVGPGARPYKRAHDFGRIIEPICEYISNPSAWLISVIEKELYLYALNTTGASNPRMYSYQGRRVVYQLIKETNQLISQDHDLKLFLLELSNRFATILINEELISVDDINSLKASAAAMILDMEINGTDIAKLTISDLGVIANPSKCLKLTTLHKSKGREFEAVGIVGANEGKIPYYNYYNPETEEGINESRRLFYVGATRAQKLLMVFSNGVNSSRFTNAI